MLFLNGKKGTKYSQKNYLKRYRWNCRFPDKQNPGVMIYLLDNLF